MRGSFFIIFTLLWSGGVVMFDWVLTHRLYEQYESPNYPSVPGIVTYSDVSSHNNRGHIRYHALIEYRYKVNGQVYVGKTLRFPMKSSSQGVATQRVHAHPVGSKVQVFYNPANPHESLLFPGIKSSDYVGLLFMMPFNLVMLGMWVAVGVFLRRGSLRPVAGGDNTVSANYSRPYGGQRTTGSPRGLILVPIVIVVLFVWSGVKRIRAHNSNGDTRAAWLAHHHTPKHDDPEVARVLGKLPEGILNPDFCTFNRAKTGKQGEKYDLFGTTRLPILEAGNRVNAFMKKSTQWQPYDFTKQADAAMLSYTSGNIQFDYTFLLNSTSLNECWLSWRKTGGPGR